MSNDPFGDEPDEPSERWIDPPSDRSASDDPDQARATPYNWGGDPTPVGARAATVGKRVGAYIIDSVLLTIMIFIVGLAIGLGGALPATPEAVSATQTFTAGLVGAVVSLAYFALQEAASGQTLGKRMLRIKVTMADWSPCTLEAALKRRVLFVIGSIVPVIGGLINFAVPLAALVTAIQDEPANQGFHDRWASTKVIEV